MDSRRIDPLQDLHIVVDILRATSVMVTLLEAGARYIRPFRHFEKAFDTYASSMSSDILLVGEREGKKIPNFHFGNSPIEIYQNRQKINQKAVFMSTTNGTRVLENLQGNKQIWIGSFLNFSTLLEATIRHNPDKLYLHCAGSAGMVSLEDVLFAGGFVAKLLQKREWIKLYDGAKIALSVWNQFSNEYDSDEEMVRKTAGESAHAKYLKSIGFEKDLDFCFSIDKFKVLAGWSDIEKGIINLSHE